jgi:hypothetical protein
MNRCDLSRIENDLRHSERRHPVDFLEPTSANGDENIGRVCEVLSRTFVWIADSSSLEQIGLRATVVLYCVRADLIGGETLEQIGLRAGCTRQSVEHLVADFCHTIGWK